MEQYSIVVLPPKDVVEYIDNITKAISIRYGVELAERPYKITLVNPFHCGEEQIQELIPRLAEIAGRYDVIKTAINGYSIRGDVGSAFLTIRDTDILIPLHQELIRLLKSEAPNLKPIVIRNYVPMVCVVRNALTHQQAELFRNENEGITLNIPWKMSAITVMKRVNGQWDIYKEIPLETGIFTRSFTAGIKTYTYTFEPVDDSVLNELYYIVSTEGSAPFIMRYDYDALQFKVEGPAPYDARVFENQLSAFIENYNE